MKRVKEQATEWEKICAMNIIHKGRAVEPSRAPPHILSAHALLCYCYYHRRMEVSLPLSLCPRASQLPLCGVHVGITQVCDLEN